MSDPDRTWHVTLDDGRLEAAAWGETGGDRPTLVLLHEGLGSVGLWRAFPAHLAEATGCRVFAYSRFGYGRSTPIRLPRPLAYMQAEATSILPRVLAAAGLPGPYVLLGHSDGATIATIYAARAADPRLAGLILLAPHFFVEPAGLEAIAAIRADWDRTDLRGRLARHHDDPDGAFLGWAGAWLDPGFPAVLELEDDLSAIRVPVLILQGTADPYGTEAHARLAERCCAGRVEVHLLPCRHAPHLEAEAATLAAIRRFLLSPSCPRKRASTCG